MTKFWDVTIPADLDGNPSTEDDRVKDDDVLLVGMEREELVEGVPTMVKRVRRVTRKQFFYKYWEPKGLVVYGGTLGVDGYYWNTAYPNGNVYITLDKVNAVGDCSHVFCSAGRAKWEVGATTEDTTSSPVRYHIKAVRNPTANAADDVFVDVMVGDYTTETMWAVKAFGIGGVPATGNKLHIMEFLTNNSGRTLATVEHYNNSGSGSQSAALLMKGVAGGWLFGNDYGLNGGDNFFIGRFIGGTAIFGNEYGVSFGGSTVNPTEALRADGTGKGFLPPRSTTAQRDAMGGKETGLLLYNTTTGQHEYWNGGAWVAVGSAASGSFVTLSGAQTITGLKTFDAGLAIGSGGSFQAGAMYYSASLGFVLGSKGGSAYDFCLTTPGGNDVLTMTTGTRQLAAWGNFIAGSDNTLNLGGASNRWAVVYAGTGTINTSDAREKTEVVEFGAAEIEASKRLSREIGMFKFLDAVREKGDAARTHVGMTVQRAMEIMSDCGLDPMAYGFICYDEWDAVPETTHHDPAVDAVLDSEGNVVTPAIEARNYVVPGRAAGSRYGFRMDELLAFIARGIDARLAALEAAS